MAGLLTNSGAIGFGPTMRNWSQKIIGGSIDLLYPRQCAHCEMALAGGDRLRLCDVCRGRLSPVNQVQCERCAATIGPTQRGEGECSHCRSESFRFERVFALGRYQTDLRQAVLRMKRPHDEPLTLAIAELMVERLLDRLHSWSPDVIVPIPMHWSRRLTRGTNSPTLLAERLASALRVPISSGALIRSRNTLMQGELSRKDRATNLRDAFSMGRGCGFSAARVLLVDDILTTGATCNAAAKVLRTAGAAVVAVAVVARAIPGE